MAFYGGSTDPQPTSGPPPTTALPLSDPESQNADAAQYLESLPSSDLYLPSANDPSAAAPTSTQSLPTGLLASDLQPSAAVPEPESMLYLSSAPGLYPSQIASDTGPNFSQQVYLGDSAFIVSPSQQDSSTPPAPPDSSTIDGSRDQLVNPALEVYHRIATAAGAASAAAMGQFSTVSYPNMLDPDAEPEPPNHLAGIYSSSGFDVITLLAKVTNRPSPQINIGPVDMSCSFVVCDARKIDLPIVYCSHTFEFLTGYSQAEIIGRNCRFLQSPDGTVSQGEFRRFTDNNTVARIKRAISNGQETQAPLLNYRKGGHSFVNMLTIVPITWETREIEFCVGFQIDLSEQPQAILNASKNGYYSMNYRRTMRIASSLDQHTQSENLLDSIEAASQILDPNEPKLPWNQGAAEVLAALGISDSEMTDKLLSKALLLNSEDLVYVISLRGVISYCSPSAKAVLEFAPEELVGTNLSDMCHPSDVVNMTRDIKEAANSPNTDINTVFRIRRKNSGYIWLESYGRLFSESGKARRCIVMIGRERPVYYLNSSAVLDTPEQRALDEVWFKLSASGIVLFASSNSHRVLGYKADDLFSKSLQSFSPDPTERNELIRAFTAVANGESEAETVEHSLRTARGEHQPATTTVYSCRQPSDKSFSSSSKHPHFILASIRIDGGSPGQSRRRRRSSATAAGQVARKRQTDHHTGNFFAELEPTRSTSWQYELRQMQVENKRLREECDRLARAQGIAH